MFAFAFTLMRDVGFTPRRGGGVMRYFTAGTRQP